VTRSTGPLRRAFAALAALVAGAVLGGCTVLAPRPDPSRFYVLEPLPLATSRAAVTALPADVSVGLGPIRVPDYLRRPELVTRTGPTEVTPSEIDRWAEPLELAVPRVLALDLTARLGPRSFHSWPWYDTQRPDYQVDVAFERLERDADGNAVLVAAYRVRDLRPQGKVVLRETRFSRTPAAPDSASLVAALSANLDDLSRELAAAIEELHQTP
jgi:hypothetical protein